MRLTEEMPTTYYVKGVNKKTKERIAEISAGSPNCTFTFLQKYIFCIQLRLEGFMWTGKAIYMERLLLLFH